MNVTLHDLATRYIGVRERAGADTHPLIRWWLSLCDGMGEGQDDETAWCSAFVNGMCWELGIPRSRRANARSWLSVGVPVELADARPGFDVCIFWRGDKDGWTGHVGFFDSLTPDGQSVNVLGGNQGDRVCVAPYSINRLLGVRRLA